MIGAPQRPLRGKTGGTAQWKRATAADARSEYIWAWFILYVMGWERLSLRPEREGFTVF
jgi:hypothetical protein